MDQPENSVQNLFLNLPFFSRIIIQIQEELIIIKHLHDHYYWFRLSTLLFGFSLFSCSGGSGSLSDADSDAQDDEEEQGEESQIDSETDGDYDPSLSSLELTWDVVTGVSSQGNGMTMVSLDNKLYLFGGASESIGTKTRIYDIVSDSWNEGLEMPRYRESAVGVSMNNLIYIIGGTNPDNCSGDYRCGQMTNVDVYSPSTNSWSAAADLNEKRDVAGGVVYENKIYVVGGMYSESGDENVSNRDSLEVYDPNTNQWTILNRDIPYPIRSAATVIKDDDIYVIGGCAEADADLDELEAEGTCQQTAVQVYHITEGVWEVLNDNMPTGRHFSGQHAVVFGNWILVFCGATDLSEDIYKLVEAFNLETLTWTSASSLKGGRKSSASAVVDNYLYVIGGASADTVTDARDGIERAYLGDL